MERIRRPQSPPGCEKVSEDCVGSIEMLSNKALETNRRRASSAPAGVGIASEALEAFLMRLIRWRADRAEFGGLGHALAISEACRSSEYLGSENEGVAKKPSFLASF